uniref:Uncharacterized protein n=1 Tax=Rhizophora mucronata TaxID=61149 RepID=A0A2P2PZ65_RHIMU
MHDCTCNNKTCCPETILTGIPLLPVHKN